MNIVAEGHPQRREYKLFLPWGEEIAGTPYHEVGRKADQKKKPEVEPKRLRNYRSHEKPGKDDS